MAANVSRRTCRPREDLEQVAMVDIILAARRHTPERGGFRPFARRNANGKVRHFLLDRGFLIRVPPQLAGAARKGPQTAGRRCRPLGGGP